VTRRRTALGPSPRRPGPPPPTAVGIVVPAHDEAPSIGLCLRAIRRAARHPALAGIRVDVVVVLDACSDDTAEAVERVHGVRVSTLEVDHRNVGQARRDGFAQLLDRLVEPRRRTWLATTDADTVVPADWLARQLAWRAQGAHAVAGTVTVTDWADRGPLLRTRFGAHQAALGTAHGHGHVHGANLGFDAAAYEAVGGMPGLGLAEDHALWTAFGADDRPVVAAGDLAVATSARRDGRAPHGFSAFLGLLET